MLWFNEENETNYLYINNSESSKVMPTFRIIIKGIYLKLLYAHPNYISF